MRRRFQFDGSEYLPEAPLSVSFLRASDLQFELILKKKIDQLNHWFHFHSNHKILTFKLQKNMIYWFFFFQSVITIHICNVLDKINRERERESI